MSGLFKSKKVTPSYVSTPADTRITEMYDMLKPLMSQYTSQAGKAYTGEMVAPLTSLEQTNLSKLSSYMNSPLPSEGETFQMAKKELGNIFGDTYDPWRKGGPIEYTGRKLKEYLNEDLLPSLRHNSAISGNLYSSGFIEKEGDLTGQIMDDLAKYAYGAEENMINRRSGAIPQALSLAELEANDPLARINDTMNLAGYERTQYQQPLDTAKYNDSMRLLQELSGITSMGVQLGAQAPGGSAYDMYRPNAYQQYIQPLQELIAGVLISSMGKKKGS